MFPCAVSMLSKRVLRKLVLSQGGVGPLCAANEEMQERAVKLGNF